MISSSTYAHASTHKSLYICTCSHAFTDALAPEAYAVGDETEAYNAQVMRYLRMEEGQEGEYRFTRYRTETRFHVMMMECS